jgi:hypothetical protein
MISWRGPALKMHKLVITLSLCAGFCLIMIRRWNSLKITPLELLKKFQKFSIILVLKKLWELWLCFLIISKNTQSAKSIYQTSIVTQLLLNFKTDIGLIRILTNYWIHFSHTSMKTSKNLVLLTNSKTKLPDAN